jgi:hypothetical protein
MGHQAIATADRLPEVQKSLLGQGQEMKTLEERFEGKVTRNGPNECWEWLGGTDTDGYGLIWRNNAHAKAHRVAYEMSVGPIPQGYTIDHLCRNRLCVNPRHMEPVTSGGR